MKKQIDNVFSVVRKYPDGVAITEIMSQLSLSVSRRTLQRYLKVLIESGLIETKGAGPDLKYCYVSASGFNLNQDALKVRETIREPINIRKPVSYKREFLNRYEPNKTFYLSDSTREHLRTVGASFHQKLQPGTYVKRILHKLLIDLSWNSSRLEGNTYSLLETVRLIEFGADAQGKELFETQMILNHKAAIEFLVESLELGLEKYVVLNIHALLSNNLLSNPKSRGNLRSIPVGIGNSVYHPPEIPQLISDCFLEIIDKASKIQDPFEQSFFLMVQLPYLQPFEDVNKRVSRLCGNIPLLRNDFSPLTFIDVSDKDYIDGLLGVYELNEVGLFRDIFVWAYERSSEHYKVTVETLGEPNPLNMKYHKQLSECVKHIVLNNIREDKIPEYLNEFTVKNIELLDQEQFSDLLNQEILGLHEGNIAVYGIKLAEYKAWCGK